MDIPNFDELSDRKSLDGDKVKIDDVLNQTIVITGFHVSESKYKSKGCGYCTKIQFYYESDQSCERKVFFSGSQVIKDQVEDIEKKLEERELPFMFKAVLKKVGNYYSLT